MTGHDPVDYNFKRIRRMIEQMDDISLLHALKIAWERRMKELADQVLKPSSDEVITDLRERAGIRWRGIDVRRDRAGGLTDDICACDIPRPGYINGDRGAAR